MSVSLFSAVPAGAMDAARHNLAMEKLSKAREDWNRGRQRRQDFISKTHNEQRHAKQTFSDLGVAMQEYHEVTSQSLPPLREKPKLSDFYNPSRLQKDTEVALVVGGMSIVGLLAYTMKK